MNISSFNLKFLHRWKEIILYSIAKTLLYLFLTGKISLKFLLTILITMQWFNVYTYPST